MKQHCVLMLVLLVVVTLPAAAQSGIGIGPVIGVYRSKDADNSKLMGGAALRLKLSDGLGVEGSVNYREEQYDNGYLTAKSWPLMVTGLVYPLPVAYGAIGAGWFNTTIDYNYPSGYNGGPGMSTSETKQRFGWHFGGGVELPVGDVAKIVGDIRYVFLDYNFKTFPGTNGLNSDFYVISGGLLFSL